MGVIEINPIGLRKRFIGFYYDLNLADVAENQF